MPVVPVVNKDIKLVIKDLNDKIHEPKHQRNLVLIIVCVALLLDNMLYMVIVPIIPDILLKLNGENYSYTTATTVTTTTIASNLVSMPLQSLITNKNDFLSIVNNLANKNVRNEEGEEETEEEENENVVEIDANENDETTLAIKTTTTKTQITSTENTENSDTKLDDDDIAVGVLFASKAFVQLFINPFSGAFIDRVGYDIPMCIGLCIIFLSTLTFAFGNSYAFLFIARSLQGVGSAFADTSGLAMIADRFTEEKERSTALGIALAFISFGSLVAPPFGGVLYEHLGKSVPFLSLAFIALFDSILLFFVMRPHRIAMTLQQSNVHKPKGTPIWRLFMDPYIAICSGALVMANVSLAFLEPTIAIWMRNTMNASESEVGYIWLPGFIPHVVGVYFTVWFGRKYPQYQWLLAAIGLGLEGASCFIIPFCKRYGVLIIPISGICFGIALVDTALLPLLGYLVDVRHTSVYGSIYAIADISYSLAYAFGPIIASSITAKFGFLALNMGICFSNLLYAPVLYLLRSFYQFKPLESTELNALSNNGSTTTGLPKPPQQQQQQQMVEKYPRKIKNQFKDTNNLIENMEENYDVDDDYEYKIPNQSSSVNQYQKSKGGNDFYETLR